MKPKISMITLGVRDFGKSLAFYRDGLGFPAHNYRDGDDHVMFKLEGSWLSLYPRDKLAEEANVADDGLGFSFGLETRNLE
jgi:catechol 2,3-dioxygenase-like lactoylglutathione lyase family enzyme